MSSGRLVKIYRFSLVRVTFGSCAEAKVGTECCSLLERLSVVELVNIEASERVVFVARLEESRGGVRWRGS